MNIVLTGFMGTGKSKIGKDNKNFRRNEDRYELSYKNFTKV